MLQRVWRKGNPPLLFRRQTGAATVEKQVGGFLKNQKTELPYNPEITFRGIYLKKTLILKDTCTSQQHTHTYTQMEYYSAIKRMKWSEVTQLCLTLCDPVDCSLPGSSIHGILQARILEWIAISFSGDLPNPGIKPVSPALQADALPSELPGNPGNEWTNAICRNMDGPRDYHTKWSKSYGERQISWYHLSADSKKNDTDELIYETD